MRYLCGSCGEKYSSHEYDKLDRQPVNPEDDNPKKGSGYERVCYCGAGFHSDKWMLRETVETSEGEITVSTVSLLIGHGRSHNQWYETCIFHDGGSRVTERYTTQEEAEWGHEEIVSKIRNGKFAKKPTDYTIDVDK